MLPLTVQKWVHNKKMAVLVYVMLKMEIPAMLTQRPRASQSRCALKHT